MRRIPSLISATAVSARPETDAFGLRPVGVEGADDKLLDERAVCFPEAIQPS